MPKYEYQSSFRPTERAERVLRSGRIIDQNESPQDMVDRVAVTIGEVESRFGATDEETQAFIERFGEALDHGDIIMSTPVMTNAGRHLDKPLTACTVPTTTLDVAERTRLRQEIITLHELGMGTGFNLDDTVNPLTTLHFLNDVAVESANSGREDRPVGNMAVLGVRHPGIIDFINAKVDAPRTGKDWKFNISIDLDDEFMDALENGRRIQLKDGVWHDARDLFEQICNAATLCADPGVIFLDKMNHRNPLPVMGSYKTTAPCAEVGLIEGETCQFGYINLGNFVIPRADIPTIDYRRLEETVLLMTRALDNSLEVSQTNLDGYDQKYISAQKRKVGIGLCGVADAITIAGIPYDSPQARELMQDVLSFINFASKEESIRLAEQRGSFGAMNMHLIGNRHRETPGHLERLYGDKTTRTVAAEDWTDLSRNIRERQLLRNISTIALPPTGRSALIIDASTGIEPHFDVSTASSRTLTHLEEILQRKYGTSLSTPESHTPEVIALIAGAPNILPMGHIAMAAALQEFTDEAIAKTINVPAGSTPADVAAIYLEGYRTGMSGVTVYVDGTHSEQPIQVK